MKGVMFGGLHSFYEWGLILSEKEIKAPKPKTIELEIEGSDGVLDYTEFFGGVRYENRQLSFKFYKANIVPDGYLALFSVVQQAIHGKKMQVILDDDPAFFYYGRVTVNEWKSNKRLGEITIDVNAEPYKYKVARTSQPASLSGKNLINLDNYENKTANLWTRTDTGFSFVRGTALGNSYVVFKVPVVAGKTYTFSASKTATGDDPLMVVYSDKVFGNVIARGSQKVTFAAGHTGFHAFALIANSATETVDYSNVMLEEGSVVTTYEAFAGTENTISVFLENLKMPSVPSIYSQDDITITNGEETFVIHAGEVLTVEEFQLKEGGNQFNITGTGAVVFDWQEGGL